ncbi:hypothetical protein N9L20_02450 [Flavobacteriaceae bacterium]|nr:hypothetical protein [Flavobacteriaceae bacterium]
MKIKFALAVLIILFLVGLPAKYIELIRYLLMVGFAYMGFDSLKSSKNESFIYFALAILYQPIFKISLGQDIWNVIDVIVVAALVYSSFRNMRA